MVQTIDRYLSNLVTENPYRSPNRLAQQALEELPPIDLDAWLSDRREILLVCYLAMRRDDINRTNDRDTTSNVYRFPQRVS